MIGPGEIAHATGVSTDTIRHYERLGLLPGVARTPAGYRRYPPTLVHRVRVIQQALAIGFSLKDLATVLHERDHSNSPPCQRVRKMLSARLEALDAHLTTLVSLRGDMRRLLREWDRRLARTPPGQRARLLDMLGQHEPLPRAAWPHPRTRRPTQPA